MYYFLKFILGMKLLHVSDSSSVHHQEFFTVHTTMVDGTAVPSWSCSQAVCKTVWHIPLLCVQWKTTDDGQRNFPKQVEFHSKNKFEKLVHLVGFIIRITMMQIRWTSNIKKPYYLMVVSNAKMTSDKQITGATIWNTAQTSVARSSVFEHN
jgi:hypothetical protein